MTDAIKELKIRAELLHNAFAKGEQIERLRALAGFHRHTESALLDAATTMQLKHCLAIVAREMGFESWDHASNVLAGNDVEDFGKLLCLKPTGHWNVWSADINEARNIRAEHGGYLLAYKKQFLIVEATYIEDIGLDPEDPDWTAMERDWTKPGARAERKRLYSKLTLLQPSK